ncbi:radical SAM family heme chaperone HemW [Planctomycetota bacterium]|nr:radical SAM family heme chaperone HemW [Planctomycetota bacterium]
MTQPSLYIHIPFCVRKCEYCDFYSGVATDADIEQYLKALGQELELRLPAGFAPHTIFMGGGTPTRLSADQLNLLGDTLAASIDISSCVEFTSEINPGTLTADKADALVRMGVNRASLGVQSFDDRFLGELGRLYESGTVDTAIGHIKTAGIKRLSMDLIFALPTQTLNDLKADLTKALSYDAEHLSLYALTYEDDTPLTRQLERGEVEPCDEELEREMFQLIGETCAANELSRYEVSNFARPDAACKHNLVYWQGGDWYGIGAGAHGMVIGEVTANASDFKAYTEALLANQKLPETRRERLTGLERAEALLLMGLRLTDGVDLNRFRQFAGVPLTDVCAKPASELTQLGLIEFNDTHVRATAEGLLVLDRVILEFASALEAKV